LRPRNRPDAGCAISRRPPANASTSTRIFAISRLPQRIYYRFKDGIAVNLYNAAEATIRLAPDLTVRIEQTTRYPSDGRIALTVTPSRPARFPLLLRIPRWCRAPRLALNGRPAESTLDREWRAGDHIEIEFPMPWRFVRGHDLQSGRAALMRGPLVFTLAREGNGLPETMPLRDITLDPESIQGPVAHTTIRPDGTACSIKAWSPGRPHDQTPDLRLTLTEFPDPDGEEIYFKLPTGTKIETDELLRKG